MGFTIECLDSSFAIATGSNVDSAAGLSRFDHPPNDASGLRITTQDGDTDPRLFEIGDRYDLEWDGSGGVWENATVVRSDNVGGDGGIVVFEAEQDGETVHLLWTPDFDVENWYWSNYSGSRSLRFYNSDRNPDYEHEYVCFERSTGIATPKGYVPAGRLKVGDTVCTLNGPARKILWIGCKSVSGLAGSAPVRFAKSVIGNFAPCKLSPQHRVLIRSDLAELQFGFPEVLVPAIAFLGQAGVRQVHRPKVTYVHFLLDCHDIVLANGAPCESLLPGFRTRDLLGADDREIVQSLTGGRVYSPARPILRRKEAEKIIPERQPLERAAELI